MIIDNDRNIEKLLLIWTLDFVLLLHISYRYSERKASHKTLKNSLENISDVIDFR